MPVRISWPARFGASCLASSIWPNGPRWWPLLSGSRPDAGGGEPRCWSGWSRTGRVLEDAYTRLNAAADGGVSVGPAGEWLLDNYHVVQEHIGEVRESLPSGYYRELPELAGGPLAGYPRVYELAITLISHTEGRVELDNVSGFVAAFQQVSVLTIGELWAIPAMLRLGLIENVRRMALRTVQRLDEIESADSAAARLVAARREGDSAVDAELNDSSSSPPPLTPTFVSRFLQQLRQEAGGHAAARLLEQWIAEEAMSAQEATTREHGADGLTQVVMANSITSLRADRPDGVARPSSSGRAGSRRCCANDPSGLLRRHDLRHPGPLPPRGRADRQADAAQRRGRGRRDDRAAPAPAWNGDPEDQRLAHVGYYLVDEGLAELERADRVPSGARRES